MLVTTAELAQHLDDSSWVIFDCRHDLFDLEKGGRVYREGHVPRAHFAPVETALSGDKTGTNGRHPLPLPEALAEFFARHGVSRSSKVVAYDDVGGQYAARLWWLARWIGLEKVALLDGGWPKWIAEGRPLELAVPEARPGSVAVKINPTLARDAKQVLADRENPRVALIDARAPERFRGEVEPIDAIAGHIPGALNRFFKLNLNADLTFRPADEIKRDFTGLLQNQKPENVVHQCGSGVTACVNLFAMEHAGLRGSKLYAGSWSEWIADPTRPVVRGTANR